MSPEQCRAEECDERSDIYALGATYYALLTGQSAYADASPLQIIFAHCSAPAPDPCRVRPGIPRGCADITLRAMDKKRADRYDNAREMRNALREAVLSGEAPRPAVAMGRLSGSPAERDCEVHGVEDQRQPREGLALISTHWPLITEPSKFVLRYAPAIRGYLQILLPRSADVDEVLQDFLLSVVERGFTPDRIHRGRFRDYLIATVRYRAWRWLRRKQPRLLEAEQAERLQAPKEASPEDADWLTGWRQCLLDRAWQTLEFKQRLSPGNWHYTALKLKTDHPDADSRTLAALVAATPPLSATSFRKQLSRARAAFARALVDEIERTLENPTPETVMEELADVGLLEYVRPYLGW